MNCAKKQNGVNAFSTSITSEQLLVDEGTIILKFYLHIDQEAKVTLAAKD